MSDVLPYRAEYAKSGRASCRGCKSPIAKDTLRLAVMVQSPVFDGKTPHWYHFMCFFGRQRPKTVGDISHFESLRWEDQEKIKAKIEGGGAGAVAEESTKVKGKKRKAAAEDNVALKDFTVEYAKSSRSTCRGCEEKIMKDEVRVSKKDFDSEGAKMYGGQERWHHVDCFAKLRDELEFWESGSCLPGIKSLKKEDQQLVKNKLPKVEKKEKSTDETDGPSPSKKTKSSNAAIREQSKIMYKYRDQLKKELRKSDLQDLLEYNDQEVPVGEERMLDRLSDIMTFGALKRCDECKGGQFVFCSGVGYQCLGDLTEWTKCQNTTLEPKRKPFRVPSELMSDHEFLKKYKYVARKRIVQLHAPSSTVKSDPSTSKPKIERAGPPLKNMEFVILGNTTRPKDELKKEIKKLGGKVVTKIHDKLAAVISTPDELEKMTKKMEDVKACDIQVLPEDFLDEVKDGGALALISERNISSWGSDPQKRIAVDVVDGNKKSKSGSMFTKSMPSKVKLKLKGGAAVDPDTKLEDVAHVYKKKDDIYNAVLGVTDIQNGRNSYYKLQLLEGDAGNRYWVFRSWGRIGTTIGSNKLEAMDSLQDALRHFESLYEEKTGNMWCNRKHFEKVPGCFYPVDLDYSQQEDDDKPLNAEHPSSSCKLAPPVQQLIQLIFDVNLMKQVMLEFELDLQKMPLGKLSKKQIQQAYSVLTDLQELVKTGGSNSRFLDASNRFYTLIPHDFGIENPPILNSEEMIKQKIEMLDSLLEIEIAYTMLKAKSGGESSEHPLDAHYAKLNTHIEVLDKDTEEFELLKQYVSNTHAATHTQYELEIVEVFKVKRSGEEKRYKPFRKLHNRKLLWHGSRLTNFAGILSQGLRIAPPEAPATGYMFGKGIYFADMVSKSANYCCTSPKNPVGLMLLCEVALGNMYERKSADYIKKLPKDKHSTKGLGRTAPDPKGSVLREDGVEVPAGKGVSVGHNDVSLLYNEYIVYDVGQVNIQYLLKMKFHYNY
ncbi:Poly [ADP-ribose] polymerase [Cryptotermes secundus]|uniref:Poly [ADP-ribose] polymerase n=2 Tax=Cryptotermes secundus TaxID=105785 RepID=A0A2J7PXW9_9NEOP|nr:poly [ADP-ribose] polymerase isoform X1 [Cryptotermes secundus]PNF21175.1 Poly [ADP-ribose] polymerase [Cryptotermes secundus]